MDKNYTVVGINGYRRGNLTRKMALRHAKDLREQMRRAGWAGQVRVYYRDGSEVTAAYECSECGNDCSGECQSTNYNKGAY